MMVYLLVKKLSTISSSPNTVNRVLYEILLLTKLGSDSCAFVLCGCWCRSSTLRTAGSNSMSSRHCSTSPSLRPTRSASCTPTALWRWLATSWATLVRCGIPRRMPRPWSSASSPSMPTATSSTPHYRKLLNLRGPK
jgi:hypothetical protein